MLNVETFIITLPNSRRKPIIEKQMNESNFLFKFANGVTKNEIKANWETKKLIFDNYQITLNTSATPIHPSLIFYESFGYRKWIKMGEIGLFFAHLDLWFKLLNDPQNDAYMILEDDAKFLFSPSDLDRFKTEYTADSFDLINNQKISPNFMNGKKGFDNLEETIEKMPLDNKLWENSEGTATYIISKKGAKKMIEFCSQLGLFCPVDNIITRSYILQQIELYFPPKYLQAGLNDESAISEIHVPVEDIITLDGILIKG